MAEPIEMDGQYLEIVADDPGQDPVYVSFLEEGSVEIMQPTDLGIQQVILTEDQLMNLVVEHIREITIDQERAIN